jgi:CBS domain-containing protein/tetratricopeptide (TPR) repeat protein
MAPRTLGDAVRRTGGAVSVGDGVSAGVVARALATHSVDAATVLTPAGTLAGIVTATDIAKMVARRDPIEMPVVDLMAAHPTMLAASETPANAIALMRAGGFRHLPVVDVDSGAVLGIVDVLHLAYDAIVRLQASYTMVPTRRAFAFMRAARDTFEKPTLRSFLEYSPFTALTPDDTVQSACEAILNNHLAAVIVVDNVGRLEGIFTCRDVTSRVVAKGLDAQTTLLRDVMTPRPDFALPDYTILECLQRMQACGFRHLPVIDDQSRKVVGLVDVLQLASDALLGLSDPRTAQEPATIAASPSSGFTALVSSLFSSAGNDTSSQVSSPAHSSAKLSAKPMNPSFSVHAAAPLRSATGSRQMSQLNVEDLTRIRKGSGYAAPPTFPGPASSEEVHAPMKVDAESSVTFKFKDCNDEYRRIKVPRIVARGSFDQLVLDIRKRYFSTGVAGASVRVRYLDEDGDAIIVASDDDLAECFNYCREHEWKTVKLKVSEAQSRRSGGAIHSDPSPVSSRANSVPGSPRREPPWISQLPASNTEKSNASESGDRSPKSASPVVAPVAPRSPSTVAALEAQSLMIEDTKAAIGKYDEAINLNSSNARALAGRGAAKLMNGDPIGAEEDYRAALALLEEAPRDSGKGHPAYDMSVVGLAETLIEQRRYEEVIDISKKLDGKLSKLGCIDALRDELAASTTAAMEAIGDSQFGDAMALFTNAIRIETALLTVSDNREAASASLRNGRAKCYLAMSDYDMACEDFDTASKLDIESVAAFKGLGKCLVELGQPGKALDAYRKARKLDIADDEAREQIDTLTKCLPDPAAERQESIAKLGALLGGMNLPSGKTLSSLSATASSSPLQKADGAQEPNDCSTTKGDPGLSGRAPSESSRRRKKRNARRSGAR